VLGRRLISGPNEKQVIKLVATIRLTQSDDSEPKDINIANRWVELVANKEDNDYEPSRHYQYSREHK
jgi:hypothetical protein